MTGLPITGGRFTCDSERALREAERDASIERLRDRLDRLALEPPARGTDRGLGIEL